MDYINKDTESLFLSVQEVGLTVTSRLIADVSLSLSFLLMSPHDLIKIMRTQTLVRICEHTMSVQLFSCKSKSSKKIESWFVTLVTHAVPFVLLVLNWWFTK